MLVFGREGPEADLMEKFAWGRVYLAYNPQSKQSFNFARDDEDGWGSGVR